MTPGWPGQAGGRGTARGDESGRLGERYGYLVLRHAGQGRREPPALGPVGGILDEVVIEGALVVNAVPLDTLVIQLGSSRGAIYKMMFDARRKLRAALAANGYIDDDCSRSP